jgi:hypothetical protein
MSYMAKDSIATGSNEVFSGVGTILPFTREDISVTAEGVALTAGPGVALVE